MGGLNMTLIPLHGKHGRGLNVIVDDDVAEELSKYRWHCNSKGYAWRSVYCGRQDGKQKNRCIYLHREVLRFAGIEIPDGYEADHINQDKRDARISNLRVVTHRQNLANSKPRGGTSRYKGVCWDKYAGKWKAQIWHNGKLTYLGLFTNQEDAGLAYDVAARPLQGEYAYCNFPENP